MIRSMTAFASGSGAEAGADWSWELRSVNAKGLDLRLRLPESAAALEPQLRKVLGARAARGAVSLGLRVSHQAGAEVPVLQEAQAEAVLDALAALEERAMARGLTLAPATAADILAQRGVLEAGRTEIKLDSDAMLESFAPVLEAFVAMREAEGAALAGVLEGQLAEIARLTEAAATEAAAREEARAETLRAALARVMDGAAEADPGRVAQELALLAVKADVTEEIDRLRAHVSAARDLLAEGGPVGRRLDFLAQEFNREANTLCSKAQSSALTNVGLALKVVIDQMREQIQNVE